MATIDEIFETMPAEASVTYEELIIDEQSRTIIIPDAEKIFGVESDAGAERKHFRCQRYVGDNLDLAGCFLRVNYRNANGETDSYLIEDVAIDGEDVTFSWELKKKVTAYKGKVQFVICAIMGAGSPEWNTTLASGDVLEGLEPDSSTVEAETADVIAQLLAMVTAQTAAVEAVGAAQCDEVRRVGENTTEEAKAAVEAKGAAVVASIPEDYTTLSNTVDRLTRDRAAAIVCEAEGETIQVNDASADPIVGLKVFGKSTQDGTPTPEAPVEIVSVEAPVVTVCEKNLLPDELIPANSAGCGITCTYEGDGVFHVSGTHTGEKQEIQLATTVLHLPVDKTKKYTFAVQILEGTLPSKFHFFVGLRSGTVTFRNWFSVPVEPSDATGLLLHDAHRPEESLGDATQVARFWIYNYNPELTKYTADFRVRVWFEQGETPTAYEPYNAQTLTLSTPTSLPGIPVTSGGNYTDANG